MIMLGLYVTGDVPFKEVYIHGYVMAEDGQSKPWIKLAKRVRLYSWILRPLGASHAKSTSVSSSADQMSKRTLPSARS
jgi:valyl-tRNA synthetase